MDGSAREVRERDDQTEGRSEVAGPATMSRMRATSITTKKEFIR
jgi:hypothetical protein